MSFSSQNKTTREAASAELAEQEISRLLAEAQEAFTHSRRVPRGDFRAKADRDFPRVISGLQALMTHQGLKKSLLDALQKSDLVGWVIEQKRWADLQNLLAWQAVAPEQRDSIALYVALAFNQLPLAKTLSVKIASEAAPDVLLSAIDRVCEQSQGFSGNCFHPQFEQLQASTEAIVYIRDAMRRRTGSVMILGQDGTLSEDAHPVKKEEAERIWHKSTNALNKLMAASFSSPHRRSKVMENYRHYLLDNGVLLNDPIEGCNDSLIEMGVALLPAEEFTAFVANLREWQSIHQIDYLLLNAAHILIEKRSLFYAARIIRALSNNYRNINHGYNLGDAPNLLQRCLALEDGDPDLLYDIVKALFEKGASLKGISSLAVKKILILSMHQDTEMVQVLIGEMHKQKIDTASVFKNNDSDEKSENRAVRRVHETVLHVAARLTLANANTVSTLLAEMGKSLGDPEGFKRWVNLGNQDASTALHLASEAGNIGAVRALIAAGACINSVNNEGYEPIHMAALSGRPGCAEVIKELLIERSGHNKTDINVLTSPQGNTRINFERTPAHCAALSLSDNGVLEAIIAAGADFTRTDAKSCTPLHQLMMQYDRLVDMDSTTFGVLPLILEKITRILNVCPQSANQKMPYGPGVTLADKESVLPVHQLILAGAPREAILACLLHTDKDALAEFPRFHNICLLNAVCSNDVELFNALLAKDLSVNFLPDPEAAIDMQGPIWQKVLFMAVTQTEDDPAMLNSLLSAPHKSDELDQSYRQRISHMLCVRDDDGSSLLCTAIQNKKLAVALAILDHCNENIDDLIVMLEARVAGTGSTPIELLEKHLERPDAWHSLNARLEQYESLYRPKRHVWAWPQAIVVGFFLSIARIACAVAGVACETQNALNTINAVWKNYVTDALRPPLQALVTPHEGARATVSPHFDSGDLTAPGPHRSSVFTPMRDGDQSQLRSMASVDSAPIVAPTEKPPTHSFT